MSLKIMARAYILYQGNRAVKVLEARRPETYHPHRNDGLSASNVKTLVEVLKKDTKLGFTYKFTLDTSEIKRAERSVRERTERELRKLTAKHPLLQLNISLEDDEYSLSLINRAIDRV